MWCVYSETFIHHYNIPLAHAFTRLCMIFFFFFSLTYVHPALCSLVVAKVLFTSNTLLFTSNRSRRFIRDGESTTSTSTSTQLLSSDAQWVRLYFPVQPARASCSTERRRRDQKAGREKGWGWRGGVRMQRALDSTESQSPLVALCYV